MATATARTGQQTRLKGKSILTHQPNDLNEFILLKANGRQQVVTIVDLVRTERLAMISVLWRFRVIVVFEMV